MHDSELLSGLNSVLQSSFSTFAGKHSRAEWKYQLRQTVQGQEAQASVQHSVPSQKVSRLWPAVCHQNHPEHPPVEGARCRPSEPPMSPMWSRGRRSHVTHEKTPQRRGHRLPTLCQYFQQEVHPQQTHWTGEFQDVKDSDYIRLRVWIAGPALLGQLIIDWSWWQHQNLLKTVLL